MTIFVRKYPFSLLCILLIWTLSLLPFFPETPFDDVAFIDKWTHLVMYGGTCCVIWWEYLHSHQKVNYNRLFLFAWLAPILMSGLLELLQEYCTTTRSGEWIDLLANTTGVTLAALIGLIYMKFK
ncbi:MAG: VanZ family protein [Prevotella sp.]|nr:VanZ family protein [Prevotella sp.]